MNLHQSDFERRVSFWPAFEKRHDDPGRDYGIGCVKARFALIGPLAAVSFDVFTGWYLPHVRERLRRETDHAVSPITGKHRSCSLEGHGGAMHLHFAPDSRPNYLSDQEDQECDLLPGRRCVGDVGYMIGEALFDALVEGGDDGLWAAMEEQYHAALAPDEAEAR